MQMSQWFYQQLEASTEGFVWAVTKTYQHTLEHTDELLRSHLWHKWE